MVSDSHGRMSMLEAYAEIVFKAWKIRNRGSREEIENGFLQALVGSAIHASSVPFDASIRKVLGGFISQRTTDGVEKLLFRLAEPVIFRSLQVANSNVRQNALHLLLDLFPLEDPNATKEGKNILLEKQFFLLEKLLIDECPAVRVVAVEGSCRLLHLFWEIITSSTITKFLTKVFDDMTHDTSKEQTLLDQTMDHLFSCTCKLIGAVNSVKFNKLPQESRHTNYRIHHGGQKHREF